MGQGHPHGPADGRQADVHAEGGWAPSRPGSVTLDIGGDIGALVLLVPDELAGHEIEAVPPAADAAHRPVHTAVRERILPGGTVQAAVFPSLRSGEYRLSVRGGGPHHHAVAFPQVAVAAGRVTEVDLA